MSGGAAFPSPGVVVNERQQGAYEGMTLRDYFAAKALLVGMSNLSNRRDADGREIDEHDRGYVARRCYEWADAMLEARGHMTPTPTQRAAYHEAARAHSIPALVAWLMTTAVGALGFAVQLARGAE